MDQFKWIDNTGKEIPPEKMKNAFAWTGEKSQTAERYRQGPKDLREFEDRIGEVLLHLKDRSFGSAFDASLGKVIRVDKSNIALIKILRGMERFLEENEGLIHEYLDTYGFLKTALETDSPLFEYEVYLLGFCRDRSGLSLPQKNVISVQCAAQVLWYLEKTQIPTIEAMEQRLLSQTTIFELLELKRFNSHREFGNPESRTIQNWIRPVFPIPPEARKEHRLPSEKVFNNLIPIPGIFSESGVNFLKLHFAIVCFARILKSLDWQIDEVLRSKFIHFLADSIRFYPRMYVNDWTIEAFSGNRSLFTP